MALITLRPNAVVSSGSWTNTGGGIPAVLSDDNESTYAQAPSGGSNLTLAITDLTTLPAGARITSVVFRVKRGSSGDATMTLTALYSGIPQTLVYNEELGSIAVGTYPPMASAPGGAVWSAATVNGLQLKIYGSANTVRVYEVYCDVYYDLPPTATILTPTGTVTEPFPTHTWAYADTEGGAQGGFQIAMFTLATTLASGFNPETSAGVGGVLASGGSNTWTPTWPPITVAGTYVSYLRVYEVGSSAWGPWTSQEWVFAGDLPNPPVLVATPEDSERRIRLDLEAQDNALGYRQASAETTTPADFRGWYEAGNCTLSTATATAAGSEGGSVHAMTTLAAGIAQARGGGGWTLADGSLALQAIPCQPLVTRTAVWRVWQAANAARPARVDWECRAVDGTYLTTITGAQVTTLTTSTMQAGSQDITPPAGCVALIPILVAVAPTAAGEVYHWDGLGLMPQGLGYNRGGLTSTNQLSANLGNADLSLSTQWHDATGGTMSRATGEATPSGAALQVTLTGAASEPETDPFPVQSLDQITIYGLCRKSEASAAEGRVVIVFYSDPEGTQFVQYNATPNANPTSLANRWSATSVTLYPPADAVSARIRLRSAMTSSTSGRWIRWSRVGWTISPAAPVAHQPGPRVIPRPVVEFSDDGGTTWDFVRGATDNRYAPDGTLTTYDYEAPPARDRLYRARTAATDYVLSAAGAELISEPSATVSARQARDGWWLKDPRTPGSGMKVTVAGSITFGREVQQTAYTPTDDSEHPDTPILKIVLFGGVTGVEGDINLGIHSEEAFEQFERLCLRGVLLFQSDYGRQWYIAVGGWEETLHSSTTRLLSPYRSVTMKATQVARPADISRYSGAV